MKLAEFDRKMNEAQDKVLAMPKNSPWQRYLYTEARANLLFADLVLREEIKEKEDQ